MTKHLSEACKSVLLCFLSTLPDAAMATVMHRETVGLRFPLLPSKAIHFDMSLAVMKVDT